MGTVQVLSSRGDRRLAATLFSATVGVALCVSAAFAQAPEGRHRTVRPPSDRGRAVLTFIDASSLAAVRPTSVTIDGLEIASAVDEGGTVAIDALPGDYAMTIIAPGYRLMRATLTVAAPQSLPNTFELVPDDVPIGATPRVRDAARAEAAAALVPPQCDAFGWVRAAENHAPIPFAQVTFTNSRGVRADTQTDLAGRYCLTLTPGALDADWNLTAGSRDRVSRIISGRATGDRPATVAQSFTLVSATTPSSDPVPHHPALVIPDHFIARAFATTSTLSSPPSTITVGLGPSSSEDNCSGMNAKCDGSSSHPCTGVTTKDIEFYVKSVIRGELAVNPIWSDAQLENFKAMAIAIRTFASNAAANRGGKQYDLCNSDACQCYHSGLTQFGPITTSASDTTAGIVLHDANGSIPRSEYGNWNGYLCAKGYIHCESEPQYPHVHTIYDYAIDQNWALRPSPCNTPDLCGHGHGLSQYGSHFRAKAGETYTSILDFYYSDYGFTLPGATTTTDPDVLALANTMQPVRWFYIATNNSTKWYIVSADGYNSVLLLHSVDRAFPGGILWKPISNYQSYAGFPAQSSNYSFVSIPNTAQQISFGGTGFFEFDPDVNGLANTTQPVLWLYINAGTRWYIVATDSQNNPAVMYLADVDPAMPGGILWKPINNMPAFAGFNGAGNNFTSVTIAPDYRSVTFGAAR